MTVAEMLDIAAKAGFSGGLLIILWGSHKGWWVWGKDHQEKKDELKTAHTLIDALRDESKQMMQDALKASEREAVATRLVVEQNARERQELLALIRQTGGGQSPSPSPPGRE